ncbi:sirohydrochlorin chelatase [Bacillus sp. 03113]|uniref:sirohydrochlorin chelatase n=1 Tax=Bacillus sp. 03113 TaxID=2578211 RepID=UPI0011449ACA|nr:sirohydrochlorin chelatase [Bacillus sp. 03113]
MEAILYICHGSRVPEACNQAISFIKKCMNGNLAPIQEYCFLELATPTIEEAFKACVQKGATTIKAIPVLLLTAAHAKEDIPHELKEVHNRYAHIKLQYGKPIGVHPKMVDILIERIHDQYEKIPKNSIVLLVGRGSSDPDVKRDLGEISSLLKQRIGIEKVVDCYLIAANPSFEEGLQIAEQSGCKNVFIIPYLLFTGILMNSMKKTIRVFSENKDQNYILCQYLGYHATIESILQERIVELTEENELCFP